MHAVKNKRTQRAAILLAAIILFTASCAGNTAADKTDQGSSSLLNTEQEQQSTQENTPGEETADMTLPGEKEEEVKGIVPDGSARSDISSQQPFGRSYSETMRADAYAAAYLETHPADYSQIKIVCFGDSYTQSVGAENETYPEALNRILNPMEVVDMGIAGCTIGRAYGNMPMVLRYTEIPADADVIVVNGGSNDNFRVTADNFGDINQPESFCSELNLWLSGLKRDYPDAKIFYLVPQPTCDFDLKKGENPALLTQEVFREEIYRRCLACDIEVIDLYNTNLLNPNDSKVRMTLYSDDTHPNDAGYAIMANIVAARIAYYVNEEKSAQQ